MICSLLRACMLFGLAWVGSKVAGYVRRLRNDSSFALFGTTFSELKFLSLRHRWWAIRFLLSEFIVDVDRTHRCETCHKFQAFCFLVFVIRNRHFAVTWNSPTRCALVVNIGSKMSKWLKDEINWIFLEVVMSSSEIICEAIYSFRFLFYINHFAIFPREYFHLPSILAWKFFSFRLNDDQNHLIKFRSNITKNWT